MINYCCKTSQISSAADRGQFAKLPELLRMPWMPWSLLRRGDDSYFQKAERRRNI